jgi:hypothetical protein
MKNAVSWDVTLCSLVEIYQSCEETCVLICVPVWRGRQKFLLKHLKFLPHYMLSHPRGQQSPPWEPQISRDICVTCAVFSAAHVHLWHILFVLMPTLKTVCTQHITHHYKLAGLFSAPLLFLSYISCKQMWWMKNIICAWYSAGSWTKAMKKLTTNIYIFH